LATVRHSIIERRLRYVKVYKRFFFLPSFFLSVHLSLTADSTEPLITFFSLSQKEAGTGNFFCVCF